MYIKRVFFVFCLHFTRNFNDFYLTLDDFCLYITIYIAARKNRDTKHGSALTPTPLERWIKGASHSRQRSGFAPRADHLQRVPFLPYFRARWASFTRRSMARSTGASFLLIYSVYITITMWYNNCVLKVSLNFYTCVNDDKQWLSFRARTPY